MKILFICKHNRFRSRVASSYFNQINKKSKNKSISAGIFPNNDPLDRWEVLYSKKLGVDIRGKPRKVNSKMLKWADLIVIVADDVKISQIKNYKKYKILVWKIEDTYEPDKTKIKSIVKKIIKRVNSFNKKIKER